MPERRNAEIAGFIGKLNMREQLVALEHLANTHGMRAYAPELAKVARACRQKWQRVQDALAADPDPSNLTLDYLAHLKGCRVERVNNDPDRWRILHAEHGVYLLKEDGSEKRHTFTLQEALRTLRALPDLA